MSKKNNIFFVGVGGIGMSALARYFHLMGSHVAGYDLTKTDLTDQLEKEGINITYTDDTATVPEAFKIAEETLVVYTPAIPEKHNILSWFRKNNFEIVKRAQLLGKVTREHQSIAVAGTHGKTSISTFTSHLLYQSEQKCNAFLGGISANYSTNLLFDRDAKYTVIEADEYDRSFLQLNPVLALISSMDADHLDIYHHINAIYEAFNQFAEKTLENHGRLIVKKELEKELKYKSKILTYCVDGEADYHALNVKYSNGQYQFSLQTPKGVLENLKLNLPGTYNLENVIAASALVCEAGISENELRKGLSTLRGVDRRFQIRINQKLVYIDDYAHHPAEIDACIASAKAAFPEKKITVAFQPHLFSRTNDFFKQFAVALNKADFVFLLPVYPAREEPIPGVTSEIIANEMDKAKVELLSKKELLKTLENTNDGVFISMGAGDIGHMVNEIENILKTGTH